MAESAFEPTRLRLARDLRGLSQTDVAMSSGLTPAAVSQFESGTVRPSSSTVDRLAEVLSVPVPFLSLRLEETHEGFFRSLRRSTVTDRRHARALACIAHDIVVGAPNAGKVEALIPVSIPDIPMPSLEASVEQVEEIAAEVRSQWNLGLGPIPHVVQLLESHGVIVIRLPLDSADVDAFSLPFHDRPVVVLGSDKNDRGRSRFDAAHELGHLVMHREQVWGLPQVEKQAHYFAAELLMPRRAIKDELPTALDWKAFFDLKIRWQVSLAALLLRAKTLGALSESSYLAAIKAASAYGWRRQEPVPLGDPESPSELISGSNVLHYLPSDVVKVIAVSG